MAVIITFKVKIKSFSLFWVTRSPGESPVNPGGQHVMFGVSVRALGQGICLDLGVCFPFRCQPEHGFTLCSNVFIKKYVITWMNINNHFH